MKSHIEKQIIQEIETLAEQKHGEKLRNYEVFHEINGLTHQLLQPVKVRYEYQLGRPLTENDAFTKALDSLNWYPDPVHATDFEPDIAFEHEFCVAINELTAATVTLPDAVRPFHNQVCGFLIEIRHLALRTQAEINARIAESV